MGNFLNKFGQFFSSLDVKLIAAIAIIIIITLVSLSFIVILFKSIKSRQEAASVKLPNIEDLNSNDSEAQFEGLEVLEFIDGEDSLELNAEKEKLEESKDAFYAALTRTTGQYMADSEDFVEMPEIGELNIEEIKKKKFEKEAKKREEEIEELRKIALSDKEEMQGLEDLLKEGK